MPSYKLHYFHATGRVEIARMLFTLKGVKFEDVTYTREEFQKVKSGQSVFIAQCENVKLLHELGVRTIYGMVDFSEHALLTLRGLIIVMST